MRVMAASVIQMQAHIADLQMQLLAHDAELQLMRQAVGAIVNRAPPPSSCDK